MKVLLTGAAGRLGRQVSRHLLELGHTVRAVDLVPDPESAVTTEVADLLDREACYRLVAGCEAVVHLANHSREDSTLASRLLSENVAMNMHLFQAAADWKLRKVVFASSVQAFCGRRRLDEPGPSALPYLPLDEALPHQPGNPYALSKVLGETMLRYFAEQTGLATVTLRLPWLLSDAARLARYCDGATIDARHKRHMNGDEAFLMLSLPDAARLIGRLLATEWTGYRVYLPANRETLLYRLTPAQIIAEYYPAVPLRQPAESLTGMADLSRLEREIGWRPEPLDFSG